MKFVMNRDFTLKHLAHSINFKKDEPQYVPPECRAEARRWGALPAEGEVDDGLEKDESPVKKVATVRDEPQFEERENILLEAAQDIVNKNDSKEFGANGAPKLNAFFDRVGFRIDAKERNDVWAKFNAQKHAAQNPSNTNMEAPPPVE